LVAKEKKMELEKLKFIDESEFALNGKQVIIGREPTNELMIADPHLSRHHGRLDLVDGVWMLDDMGSTLGTTLNGVLVRTPVALNDGDLIVFGRTIEVRFVNE
jgi:pSer/pThr/pTyr-binding forkhead associated (FHA) protein